MSTSIKICGITNTPDAKSALQAGADYLGLIFVATSPRSVSVADAKRIRIECREAHLVGVFQNADPEVVKEAVETLRLDFAQLHGDEDLNGYQDAGPLIQVIQDLTVPIKRHPSVQFLLLDRSKATPQENWVVQLQQFVESHPELPPFWIAGGFTPETVGAAIQAVQPHSSFCGVDVASGVENAAGQKDVEKMAAFCAAVKEFI